MKVIECAGSPRRMGQCQGEALREEVRRELQFFPRPAVRGWERRLATFLLAHEQHLPGMLEMMRGIAEGAGVADEEIFRMNFSVNADALVCTEGCTNVVFGRTPQGPIWGKNNDGDPPGSRRPACALLLRPADGIPAVSFTYCATVVGLDTMNAEGLAVGHSSVGSVFQQSDRFPEIRLWGLEAMLRCRTVAEFIGRMARLPLRGKGYSMVCVDRQGAMCSLEAPCPLVQIRKPDGPRGVHCVNCYQLPALKDADTRVAEAKADSLARKAMLDAFLASEAPLCLEQMKSLLRQHGDPPLCRHGVGRPAQTEYSMIGLPRENRVLFLAGYPCQGEYQEILL